MERIFAKQLTSYLISHKIHHIFQSDGTILALLDLSSAFDTINHTILNHRLTSIGITGTAHTWLSSFITNQTSSVLVYSTRSSSRLVTHDVTQGSVIGPIIFNIYINTLLHLILNSPVSFHTYADDIQLYVKCTKNEYVAPAILSYTITTMHNWLTINSLVFNPIKTEAIFLHLPLSKTLPTPPPINIYGLTLMESSLRTQPMSKILVLYLTILLILQTTVPHNKTIKLSTTFTTPYSSFNINIHRYYYKFCLHPTSIRLLQLYPLQYPLIVYY